MDIAFLILIILYQKCYQVKIENALSIDFCWNIVLQSCENISSNQAHLSFFKESCKLKPLMSNRKILISIRHGN